MSTYSAIQPTSPPENATAIAPSVAFWCDMIVPPNSTTSEEIPHVNNAEYVRWIAGLTRDMLLEARRMWFVARHEIDYRGESFVGDKLVIATWISDFSRTTAVRRTRVHRPSDDKTILDASTRWAYVNLDTRRPTRMHQDVLDKFPLVAPEDADR